jgi:hypothetical protein
VPAYVTSGSSGPRRRGNESDRPQIDVRGEEAPRRPTAGLADLQRAAVNTDAVSPKRIFVCLSPGLDCHPRFLDDFFQENSS